MKRIVLLSAFFFPVAVYAHEYTHADTLRGSNGPYRAWWDVTRYELSVDFDTATQSIIGHNTIFFTLTGPARDTMQIDLQEPMMMDSVVVWWEVAGKRMRKYTAAMHEGNVWWVVFPFRQLPAAGNSVTIYYHGAPRKAVNPPWDGGFSWKRDSLGRPWIAVSCQGLGASVWWPCKDAQWDEPDNGMQVTIATPSGMQAVSNGMQATHGEGAGKTATTWEIKNPVNNYDVTFYLGSYISWQDTLMGEKGALPLSYYVLDYNEERARKQFAVVKQMLRCFEYWMGPYPFYEDGYKLVEAPYLGMEHQSAVAYGNKFKMGYKGMDRSWTGFGLKWDYIIIHESGHEWFGNNVTAADMADNWIHEGFTSYTEVLFTECLLGKESAMQYSRGLWKLIRNDKPVIGNYGVNEEAGGDIYEKGAAVVHMIRTMMGDDQAFRKLLRDINTTYYHKIVTSRELETFITKQTGLDLAPFFHQYLRTTEIPRLEYGIKKGELSYRFANTVPGFSLPVTVTGKGAEKLLRVSGDWQRIDWDGGYDVEFSKDFLMKVTK